MKKINPIGDNIRMWLKIRNMKQEILARKLRISNSAMSQIINNKIKLSSERKMEISKHLDISTEQLETNPMQVFNFTNCNAEGNSNVNQVQNIYQVDTEFIESLKTILPTLSKMVKDFESK